jgi:hypothetical protein
MLALRALNNANVTFGCAHEVLHRCLILGAAICGISCFEIAELDDGYALQGAGLIREGWRARCQNPATMNSDDWPCCGRISVDAGLVRN